MAGEITLVRELPTEIQLAKDLEKWLQGYRDNGFTLKAILTLGFPFIAIFEGEATYPEDKNSEELDENHSLVVEWEPEKATLIGEVFADSNGALRIWNDPPGVKNRMEYPIGHILIQKFCVPRRLKITIEEA
jgi:hypothetical protein